MMTVSDDGEDRVDNGDGGGNGHGDDDDDEAAHGDGQVDDLDSG